MAASSTAVSLTVVSGFASCDRSSTRQVACAASAQPTLALRTVSPLKQGNQSLTDPCHQAEPHWTLPCPTILSQEPEGASPAQRVTVEACNQTLSISSQPGQAGSQSGRGFEIVVGVAKVPKFTPEKARLLRQRMKEADSHHDLMYHSALAARLA